MDTGTINQITIFAQAITTDIREWNQLRINQLVEQVETNLKAENQEEVKRQVAEKIKKSQQLADLTKMLLNSYKKFFFWLAIHLSGAAPALFMMAVCGITGCVFGAFIGLNVLPNAVSCESLDSLCYRMRYNKDTTLPESPLKN